MSKIFDNVEFRVEEGLNAILTNVGVKRADFCVGYFNLRGWKLVCDNINKLDGDLVREGPKKVHRTCRLLIGMHQAPRNLVQEMFSNVTSPSNENAIKWKRSLLLELRKQLTYGYQTKADEDALCKLQKQLEEKKVVVKLHLRYPLHAKLYLAHRPSDTSNPIMSIMGSSNLTLSGLYRNGELNAEFGDPDDGKKFNRWFNERWNDTFSLDITDDLIKILDESWASEKKPTPYEIYLKIMYHLSQEARGGVSEYSLPQPFSTELYDFQKTAVQLVLRHLKKRGGALLGDVVGLGKTITACAVAKYYEVREGVSTLILCPPNLKKMWQQYAREYDLKVEVRSIAKTFDPKNERFYKLVIIDESHNLRNGGGKRYNLIRELLQYQESNVLLLTATPYNKDYSDIAAQLKLFLDADEDLGIRPERCIKNYFNGEMGFVQQHPDVSMRSIRAFELSTDADDWRDLLKLYLVRRTRTFIKNNYALVDEENPSRRYLLSKDGTRNYFPDRIPKTIRFETAPNDMFSRLYSEITMDLMGDLNLPRYGLKARLDHTKIASAPDELRARLEAISSAGKRLMGFCRSNLCKRMDSSGVVFLMSLYRHAVRNAMFIYALKNNLPLPIAADIELDEGWVEEADENEDIFYTFSVEPDDYLRWGREAYEQLKEDPKNTFWLPLNYVKQEKLKRDLQKDNRLILDILRHCGAWVPAEDKKLHALIQLLTKEHKDEKVLIFTQYADTARYITDQLVAAGLTHVELITGGMEDIIDRVQRFSPRSNKVQPLPSEGEQTRILVATDALSEGQNLQDAHIVINYDLPWAIIRLIQRAGRVDRIGQKASQVWCYSFFPQEGVDKIINLTARLNNRINSNADAVGSDEIFFEGNKQNLKDIFNEKAGILDETDDGEVDIASQAYQIWEAAIKGKPELAKRIIGLADVVYSTKPANGLKNGVITYAHANNGAEVLTWLHADGTIATQSLTTILSALTCTPDTPTFPALPNHHDLVKSVLQDVSKPSSKASMGILGTKKTTRFKLFDLLRNQLKENAFPLFEDLYTKISNDVYTYPLCDQARTTLTRMFAHGESAANILNIAQELYEQGSLCILPTTDEQDDPTRARVICSLGLSEE